MMLNHESGRINTVDMDPVWQGVANLLDEFVDIRIDDQVVLLHTPDAQEATGWVFAELISRGVIPKIFPMNPLVDITVEQRLREALPPPDSLRSRLVLLTLERDTMSHFLQLRRALAPYDPRNWAVYRLINASAAFFRCAMNTSPDALSGINGALLSRMMPAQRMHIASSSGSDLDVEIDSTRYRWTSNRGVWRQDAFIILPPGEVSTFPANINGTLVADGAFNLTADVRLDARLADHPVTLNIERGRLVDFRCADPLVTRMINRCLTYEFANIVGELGFGTNVGINEFVPMNSHINERHPGLHIGLGQHGQRRDAVPYQCEIHLDLITSDATVNIDGQEIVRSEQLAQYENEDHPSPVALDINDEDIDGDCCGIIPAEVAKAKVEYLALREGDRAQRS